MSWIPELARLKPQRFMTMSYEVSDEASCETETDRILKALRASSLEAARGQQGEWHISLPSQTRVYGVVAREIDEHFILRVEPNRVILECHPAETQAAHFAGLVGILLIAGTAWLAGGFAGGWPAALAICAAGILGVEVTRQWAYDALENELRTILVDLGNRLWPSDPAQITALMRPASEPSNS